MCYAGAVFSYTLITGASSGIGEAAARLLAKQKRNLILMARRKERLDAIAEDLKKEGIDVIVQVLDVTDAAALEKFFASLKDKKIDAVINNAGGAFGRDHLEDATDDDLQKMIDLDISAFTRVTRLSVPHLKKTKGHLIAIGSIAGREVYEGGLVYCGAKHFVHAVIMGLRTELLGTDIRVTEIAPGAVDTEFSLVRYHGDRERAKKVYEGFEPLHAADIADGIWYALSRPKHVTIEHLLIMPTAQSGMKTFTGK